MKPTVYMLIGLPGSGKSTWTNNYKSDKTIITLSTDDVIALRAELRGVTYDEAFADSIEYATKLVARWADECRQHDTDVIWDQTNLTKASRAKKLRQLPNHRKVAVVFLADEATLKERRANRPGKTIPQHVLRTMKLELPSTEEGFDEIIYINA